MHKDSLIARALTRRYLIALTLVAMLATSAWFSLHLVISAQQSNAAIVNISGRQRMLSQRTALFSSLLVAAEPRDRPAIRRQLREAAELMRRSHRALIRGDTALGLPDSLSDTVRQMYFSPPLDLDRRVETYLDAVQELAALPDAELRPDHPLLREIIAVSPTRLVAGLDRMVSQYQREGETAIRRLQRAETGVWLLTLLLLLLEGLFIFQPFARQTRLVLGQLNDVTDRLRRSQDELEERVRQRTRDLEQKRAELAESEQKFRLISTSAQDAILIIDQREAITYWNPAATKLFGYAADQVIGHNLHQLLAPARYQDDIRARFARFCASGEGPLIGKTFEITALRQGGEEFPIELSISTLTLNGELHALGIVRDISERKQLEAELRKSATTDYLTGLANRRHFMECMNKQLARLRRQVTPGAAVLMVDLDHFKRVNDSHGHAAGDALLCHVARLMRLGLRQVDSLGRLGGEEFALLLPGTDLAGAGIVAERLRQTIEMTPLEHQGRAIAVTVSVGIALMDAADADADRSLERADQALYRAKAAGRNRVEAAPGNAPPAAA